MMPWTAPQHGLSAMLPCHMRLNSRHVDPLPHRTLYIHHGQHTAYLHSLTAGRTALAFSPCCRDSGWVTANMTYSLTT